MLQTILIIVSPLSRFIYYYIRSRRRGTDLISFFFLFYPYFVRALDFFLSSYSVINFNPRSFSRLSLRPITCPFMYLPSNDPRLRPFLGHYKSICLVSLEELKLNVNPNPNPSIILIFFPLPSIKRVTVIIIIIITFIYPISLYLLKEEGGGKWPPSSERENGPQSQIQSDLVDPGVKYFNCP